MPRIARRPTHAGSWYERDPTKLQRQIDAWMAKVDEYDAAVAADPALLAQAAPPAMPGRGVLPTPSLPLRAIIGPHAGYSYCGHVMAHAYRYIDPARVSRVFLLGPSHHLYSRRCLLSTADDYSTPLGPLKIDKAVVDELKGSGLFDEMSLPVDEAEHSLELHTSFIASVMRGRDFALVPIMVGVLSAESEKAYARLLYPFLDDPANLFIVSTDFCHYGARFNYEPFSVGGGGGVGQEADDDDDDEEEEGGAPTWRRIARLDAEGMRLIEAGDAAAFREYLGRTGNTICGRNPCGLLLATASCASTKTRCGFRFYDQSSKVVRRGDSSVSYASALLCACD